MPRRRYDFFFDGVRSNERPPAPLAEQTKIRPGAEEGTRPAGEKCNRKASGPSRVCPTALRTIDPFPSEQQFASTRCRTEITFNCDQDHRHVRNCMAEYYKQRAKGVPETLLLQMFARSRIRSARCFASSSPSLVHQRLNDACQRAGVAEG